MTGMKSSWDQATHQQLLDNLRSTEFPDIELTECEEPFSGSLRQPDLKWETSSIDTTYIYFLQPEEVTSSFFEQVLNYSGNQLHLYLPVSRKEQAEEFLDSYEHSLELSYYRLRCGQIQVFDA